jgi:hypothetical protein
VDGLLRDRTRPSRIPKLAEEKVALVLRLTLGSHHVQRDLLSNSHLSPHSPDDAAI